MADIYFSPTGDDDTGDGSEGNPYETISKAHTEASTGDTLYAMAGTHTWVTTTITKAVTIQGASPTTTIFDAGGTTADVYLRNTVNGTIVNDITFTNNGTSSSDLPVIFSGLSNTTTNIYFNRCIFYALYYNTTGGASDSDQSIFGTAKGFSNTRCGTLNFNSCVFYDLKSTTAAGYVFADVSWSSAEATTGLKLKNCSIYLPDDHTLAGIFRYNHSESVPSTRTMTNTIISSVDALDFGAESGFTCTYSCLYNITDGPTGTGVITSDPLFIDGDNGDLRLRPDSPCIETGTII